MNAVTKNEVGQDPTGREIPSRFPNRKENDVEYACAKVEAKYFDRYAEEYRSLLTKEPAPDGTLVLTPDDIKKFSFTSK